MSSERDVALPHEALSLVEAIHQGRATQVEEWAVRLLGLLPAAEVSHTSDAVQLDWGGESGIVVIVTAEAIELRLPTVEWAGGVHTPVPSGRLWKRRLWRSVDEDALGLLIEEARRAREAEFRHCRFCGRPTPPEHRIDARTCHNCAEARLGIVF